MSFLNGAAPANVTHTFNAAGSGVMDRDGSTVTYAQIEAITDLQPAANRVFLFNLGGNDVITVDTNGAQGRVEGVGTGAPVSFDAPTESLTLQTLDGSDAINIQNLPAGFAAIPLQTISGNSINVTANTNVDLLFDFGAGGEDTFTGNAITASSLGIVGAGDNDLVNLTAAVVALNGGVDVNGVRDIITHAITAAQDIILRHDGTLDTTLLGIVPQNLPNGTLTINSTLSGLNVILGPDAGIPGVPSVATIIAPGDLAINAQEAFIMRNGGKFVVSGGNLTITAPTVVLTEVAVNGVMTVTSPDITINTRGPALVFDANGQLFLDSGTDFFANAYVFSSSPALVGGNRLFLAMPVSGSFSQTLNIQGISPAAIAAAPIFTGTGGLVAGLALDFFDPNFATLQNVSQSLASALPAQLPAVAQSTSIGQADREKLLMMEIPAQYLDTDELVRMLRAGRRNYDDVGVTRAIGLGGRVTVNRLRSDAVGSAVDVYDDLLGTPDKRDQVKKDMQKAVGEYLDRKETFDPVDFRDSLADDSPVRLQLDKLGELFSHLRRTNLSDVELRKAMVGISVEIQPEGMSMDQFLQAVTHSPK